MAMIKKHKQTLLSALQRMFCFILAATILGAVGVPSAVLALDNSAPTVEIVGFMRGDSKDLRSSELLMAKLSNYSGNPEELTYEWENKLGTYLYVFDKHDMAVVRGTKSEIEIYNTDKNVSPSKNMAGRTYNKTYSKKGFAYAAVYGAEVSSEKLKGGISVKVKDSYGNTIATASYTDDFKDYDLSKDMANAVFGVFEGETVDILNLLGQSSVVHVVCPACYVSQGMIVSGSDCISLEKSPNGYSIRGLKAGEGVITIKLEKKNCKFHMGSENSSTTTVKVFKKPNTSTTATTLTLTNLDDRCEYYIGGVKGEVSDEKILFTNLTPSTEYTVEVRGNYIDDDGVSKTAYAYVKDTTKNSYSASVVFKLDDSIADTETIFGNAFEVAVKSDDDYILLQSSENGYTAELTKGNYKVYLKDGNNYKQIEDVVLCVDENNNSAEIKYYSVLYDLNGGTLNEDLEYIYREGASVTTIASKPTKYEYVFDGWQCGDDTFTENQIITESINRKYELSAIWEVDKIGDGENPDGIPDKYQKKVTFKVVNGTWKDKTNKDISFYVTLLDDNGNWSVDGSARINIPTGMIANYGYENGKWDIEPKSPVKGTNVETFTYAFSKKTDPKVDYKEPKENDKPTPTTQVVDYGKKIQVKPNGGVWTHDGKTYKGEDVATFVLEKNIKLDDPTRTNYVFMGWDKKKGTGDIAYIFTAIWEVDKIGDGENPDGIPDKYQKKVTFKVVNGTWEDKTNKAISFYVTLLDDNGKWSVNGSARINIPTGMIANYGYENGKWDIEPKSPVKGTNVETFTYAFSKKTDPKVDYKEPKENDKPTPTTQVVEYGKKIQVKPNGGVWIHDNKTYSGSDVATFVLEKNIKLDDPTRTNYVFMGWDKKKGTGDIAYIFTAIWEVDKIGDGENPDGIPDKYQKKVTFKVVNGTWADKSNKDISFYVTLLDDNGNWSVNGSARINIPTGMIANYGYENGKWDIEPKSPVKGTNAETFTYAFSKKTDPKVDYKEPKENDKPTPTTQVVEYGKKIQVKPNGGVWIHDNKTYSGSDVATFVLEKNIKLDDPTRTNYVFMGWDKKRGTGDIAYIFTAIWEVDKIGDGENPDGIPDKYQKKVTFKVVNGTWENKTNKDISFYVTLLDDNGKWSVDGSARINIPTGMIANYGYENGKWDIEPKSPVKGTNAETFTYAFSKKTDPKVDYKEPKENDKPTPTTQVVDYGKKIQVKPNGGVWIHDNKTYSGNDVATFVLEKNIKLDDPTRTNYVFMGWDKKKGTGDIAYIFTALWEVDKIGDGENPDGIPDKYQKKVTFKVVNGTWEDKTNKDISFYVTLLDDNGKWSVNGSARINIPTGMIANYGYENGKWDIEPKSPVKGTNAETFTYAFSKKTDPKVDYKEPKENDKPTPTTQVVDYGKKIQVKPNGGVWTHDGKTYKGEDVATFVLEKNIKLDDPTRTNYVFMGWDKKKGTGDIAYIFTALWEVDKIGDGENPDGIPDKYQKKVTFKVVNGTWEDKTNKDISFYVTLLDDNGNWSVNGSARINIPTGMIANYGYENGKWDIEPTQTVSGTEEVIYVYSFEKIAETKPQPTTSQPTPTVETVVQEKTVYKTQYVEPITLKTGENLTFLGVLSGLCALGFAGTIIFAKKRSK